MSNKTVPSFVGMTPSGNAELGRIQIAPEVLEVIIGIATMEVKGVVKTSGNFVTGVAEKFGKMRHGKGVKVEWLDDGLVIDVYCTVGTVESGGNSVQEIATEIQKQVRHAVFHMTSLETKEVNVHITGIQFETGTEKE